MGKGNDPQPRAAPAADAGCTPRARTIRGAGKAERPRDPIQPQCPGESIPETGNSAARRTGGGVDEAAGKRMSAFVDCSGLRTLRQRSNPKRTASIPSICPATQHTCTAVPPTVRRRLADRGTKRSVEAAVGELGQTDIWPLNRFDSHQAFSLSSNSAHRQTDLGRPIWI